MKYEVGEHIGRKCPVCGMETEHLIIPSIYADTQDFECLICHTKDEEIV